MRLAFILLVHKDLAQVQRFAELLSAKGDLVFIHIDKKCSEDKNLIAWSDSIIEVSRRESIAWGSFEMVQATLNALQQIVNNNIAYDWAFLLSGQDYLVKPLDQLKSYLSQYMGTGTDFIEIHKMVDDNDRTFIVPRSRNMYSLNRIKYYYFNSYKSSKGKFFVTLVEKMLQALGFKKRISGEFYAGSMWWGMSDKSVKMLLSSLEDNPGLIKPFTMAACSDESFFQTLLALNRTNYQDILTYIKWENEYDSHPIEWSYQLLINEWDSIATSNKFFIRKISDKRSLNFLDQKLGVTRKES